MGAKVPRMVKSPIEYSDAIEQNCPEKNVNQPEPITINKRRNEEDYHEYLPGPQPVLPNSLYIKNISNDVYYDMEKPGLAIIFNHFKYNQNNASIRHDTYYDVASLEKILKKINFKSMLFNDPTASKMDEVLDAVNKIKRSEISCLMFIVMTHGSQGYLRAADYEYKVQKLWNNFTAEACPQLVGIPKLFFIQACRGDDVDKGHRIVSDSVSPIVIRDFVPPSMADFLHMYSSSENYKSWRSGYGSWFIQELCKVLDEEVEYWDLLQLLSFVNKKVAYEYEVHSDKKKYNKTKQMPQIVTTLTKLLKFKVVKESTENAYSNKMSYQTL